MLESAYFLTAILYKRSLSIKLNVKITVDVSALFMNRLLLINFRSQCLHKSVVGVNSLFVVFLHLSFLFVQASERLLKRNELILKSPVVSLAST